jgi:hypothetical protein
LFALREIDSAFSNKSVMPAMLLPFSWDQAKASMHSIAQEYFMYLQKEEGL